MTDEEIARVFQKFGPEWVDNDPCVAQAFHAICYGDQPIEDTLFSLVRVLAERVRTAEDTLMIDRLKRKT